MRIVYSRLYMQCKTKTDGAGNNNFAEASESRDDHAVLYTPFLCREKEFLSIGAWTYLMSMYLLEHGDEQQDVGQWGRTEEH